MSIFRSNKTQALNRVQSAIILTLAKELGEQNISPTSIEGLTFSEIVKFLFAHQEGGYLASEASDSVKQEFERSVLPYIKDIADEVMRNMRLGEVVAATLLQRRKVLGKLYGKNWKQDAQGAQVAYLIDRYSYGVPEATFFAYKALAASFIEKTQQGIYGINWRAVLVVPEQAQNDDNHKQAQKDFRQIMADTERLESSYKQGTSTRDQIAKLETHLDTITKKYSNDASFERYQYALFEQQALIAYIKGDTEGFDKFHQMAVDTKPKEAQFASERAKDWGGDRIVAKVQKAERSRLHRRFRLPS